MKAEQKKNRARQLAAPIGGTSVGLWNRNLLDTNPFPPRMTRRMRWCASFSLTSAVSGTTIQELFGTEAILYLNTARDMQQAAGTHQPYGWTTMSTIYRSYLVKSSTLDFDFVPSPGSSSLLPVVGIEIQPSSESYNLPGKAVSDLQEHPASHIVYLDSTGISKHVTKRFQMHQVEGLTQQQYMDEIDDYGSQTATGNAVKNVLVRMAVANLAGTTTTTVNFLVTVTQDIEFFERIELGASNGG